MPFPIVYRGSGNQLATYNFADLVSGTGYIMLYGAKDESGGILTPIESYSDASATVIQSNSDDYELDIDLDFDITVNRPITLSGIAWVNVPLLVETRVWGSSTGYAYIIVKLRKYSGAAETEIASATSTVSYATSTGSAGPDHDLVKLISITVPTTVYKKGDLIRLTLEVYSKRTAGSTVFISIGHDPKNKLPTGSYVHVTADCQSFSGSDTTQMIFAMPVKVDV